ncbi:BolA/IbaG family iron-sulfur metabolism protein [Wolbachia endosymbiont of Cruorifilaria tuberocauda]|uniref:BolA/IbaG family iron-sulfur metabolism protein n=1 Tax=Wolbachia endosymbiont of Cruorifilaria tuberocauda TaxID=1812111 RepID=UPI00158B5BA6|nr:BolA/IbaG family iron-sulfur metabolism protein [Wolbachia endosymbiont of Cruorifilaria tuberocauda]QKX01649.1 BolA/IbaG family iron-sulfur metabolism protein [Wolbachia endosymbiont of Cruorifilaria tuberocauda]
MVITVHELEKVVKQSFPDANIEINDLTGDNNHYHLKIISKCFLGKTRVEQHKMVYKALENQSIHALQLETST